MDFGTSSIKLSILDERYTILRSSKIAYQIRIYNGDWSELDGEVLLDAMLKGIKSLDIGSKGIDLICFCTFSPSLVLMDGAGNPVYPIFTHLDRRSKKQTR
ncbi:MAG: FGGY family carbohydrate kinase, partial [Sphaerochaetaceae bacterium]